MTNSRRQARQNLKSYYLLSFLIPLLIITTVLAVKGIYLGSERTILASDGFHQYAIFNTTLRNILHRDGHLFYTFTSGLGLNFYALSSYYLGSIFSPFVYFFSLKTMPDAIYLFTVLKFGLIGLSSYYSLHHIYHKIDNKLTLILSTHFALMSFTVSQLEINMWLDVLLWVPLILLGLHRLILKQGTTLYYVCLTLLFIQNYYFGYMTALFLIFWYFLQVSWNFKERIKTFFSFTIVSTLSGLTSLIMILPALLDLRTHGENFTVINQLQTENSWWLDIFAKSMVGGYDTTKFGAIPMIYVGLVPLIIAVSFFFIKPIKWQVKLTYLGLFFLLIFSFYIEPLNLFWQGMHAPNMFLHRYAWLFSLLIIFTAAEVFSQIEKLKLSSFLTAILLVSIGFGLTFYFKNHYPFLEIIHYLLTVEFLIVYVIIFICFIKKVFTKNMFTISLLFFTVFEVSLNSYYQISGIDSEWHFPSQKSYQQDMADIVNLVDSTRNDNYHFFRMERQTPQTGNDSMKYNYNGISQFSSIRNRASSQLLDKLGFKSSGTNLNLRYQNNTLLMDSLFAIKYNISQEMPLKYGFEKQDSSNQLNLYKNVNASQLGLLIPKSYQDIELTSLSLDNQTDLINALTGLNLTYFSQLSVFDHHGNHLKDKRQTLTKADSVDQSVGLAKSFTLQTEVDSQVYISLPDLILSNDNHQEIQISVNDHLYLYTLDNSFTLFDLGYFTANQTINVTLHFPQQSTVSFDYPKAYALSIKAYESAFEKLTERMPQTTVKGNQVKTNYEAKADQSLLYTIPYDKGWSAIVNGETIPIEPFQDGLIHINVPEGRGEVILTFIPQGFLIGLLCFLCGLFLFIIHHFFYTRNRAYKKSLSVK
ncbi:YfhO family protein [Streptococcus ovuberis]|uniref:YfhO family protein n=1 Tax=Streptococcus ovuberis TaxID=1936207 RepID=A0A7X6MYB8_9STRE|nr:YfhO family protein [Streptococcus ovuberis]NKZ20610.1 YfhO family protein [Streptococcus ovuberis]